MDHSIPLEKKERKGKVLNAWCVCVCVCVAQAFFSLHSSTVTFLWDIGGQEECVSFFFFGYTRSYTRTLGCCMWYLVPWPGIEPWPSALGAQSLSHWTTREVPRMHTLQWILNHLPWSPLHPLCRFYVRPHLVRPLRRVVRENHGAHWAPFCHLPPPSCCHHARLCGVLDFPRELGQPQEIITLRMEKHQIVP